MEWRLRIAEFERLNPQDESGRIIAPPPMPAPVTDPAIATAWTVGITIALFFLFASGLWVLLLFNLPGMIGTMLVVWLVLTALGFGR